MVYSIISAIQFKKLQVFNSLNMYTLKDTFVNLITHYTFNEFILVLHNNFTFYTTCVICQK